MQWEVGVLPGQGTDVDLEEQADQLMGCRETIQGIAKHFVVVKRVRRHPHHSPSAPQFRDIYQVATMSMGRVAVGGMGMGCGAGGCIEV